MYSYEPAVYVRACVRGYVCFCVSLCVCVRAVPVTGAKGALTAHFTVLGGDAYQHASAGVRQAGLFHPLGVHTGDVVRFQQLQTPGGLEQGNLQPACTGSSRHPCTIALATQLGSYAEAKMP
jgi:hypothetical protein